MFVFVGNGPKEPTSATGKPPLLSPSYFLTSAANIAKKKASVHEEIETQVYDQSQEHSDDEEEQNSDKSPDEKGFDENSDENGVDQFDAKRRYTPPPAYNEAVRPRKRESGKPTESKLGKTEGSSLCDGCHLHVCICDEQNISVQNHESEDAYEDLKKSDLQKAGSGGVMTLTRQASYNMSEVNCGRCVIFNNFRFNDVRVDGLKLGDRHGTDIDEKQLISVFEWLGFQVDVFPDADKDGMRAVLMKFAEMDHSSYDSFVCCILSHGYEGGVYGVDGEKMRIQEIQQMFEKSDSLVGKPKIFFIQACQGERDTQPVVVMHQDSPIMDRRGSEGDRRGSEREERPPATRTVSKVVPSPSDFIFAMATTPG